ncbi:hypothetical protein ABK040_015962 [Willaertia magna]
MKEILLYYFEIEAKELFGNYYIGKRKIAKVGLKAEDKYLVKNITFYNNCEKIKEMEFRDKIELKIHLMYLFKRIRSIQYFLEVVSFYKKSYELLKKKYEKAVSIIELFNELYSDIVNWQIKNSKQVNKISKEFTIKKETDVVERSYYCRFISRRVCDINKEGMDYLLNEKNIYNRFIFIAKKLFLGDSLVSILNFNKLSTV